MRFGVLHPNTTEVIQPLRRSRRLREARPDVIETKFKSGQTVEGVEQLWRGRLDFYMGGAPEVPRLNSRVIEGGRPAPLAVVSGANPGHTSLVLGNKLHPKAIDEILSQPLRIAVSSLSSIHLAFFRGYLRTEKKLELDGIKWRFLGVEAANMLPALLTGQIDGFLHSEPTTTLAIVNKAGHLFMQSRARRHGAKSATGDPHAQLAARLSAKKCRRRPALHARNCRQQCSLRARAGRDDLADRGVERTGRKDHSRSAGANEPHNAPDARTSLQKWWDFIGNVMVERGEISPKVKPFPDVFDLSFQAS